MRLFIYTPFTFIKSPTIIMFLLLLSTIISILTFRAKKFSFLTLIPMRSLNSHKKSQPSSSKQTPLTFQRGECVEIVSQEDGFEGSYYAANIISSLGNNDYIIQYKTLVKEDNSGLLREVMSAENIQKFPDKIDVTEFSVGDVVDAYDKDGWWVGNIFKKSGSKYYVYFKGSGERNAYPISLLRVHQEWDDGKWVRNCSKK